MAVVGQVSRHWPVLLATASARDSVVNPNARIEAPGRPSGLSSGDMNRSTPTSASQPITLVAYPQNDCTPASSQDVSCAVTTSRANLSRKASAKVSIMSVEPR